MEVKREQELLQSLRDEFDDYIDYWKLIDTVPQLSETKAKSLLSRRHHNGLAEFSYWTNRQNGVCMVSFHKFKLWVRNNFRPLDDDE